MGIAKIYSILFPQNPFYKKQIRTISWVLYSIYICLFIYFSLHHCRWFDETQAWLIARETNPLNLLAAIRYEFHPVLWYLVLMLPAHVLSFASMTLVTTILVAISFYMLLFKAPFHWTIRFLLPLTYFIFYQYGIIARSYVLFITLSLLAAATFPNRFRGNGFFVSVLLLLTLELHSLMVGVGLMLAFGLEVGRMLVREKRSLRSVRPYLVQIAAAAVLALGVIVLSLPAGPTYFTGLVPPVVVNLRRLYMLATESLFSVNTFWMNRFVDAAPHWFTWQNALALAASGAFYGLLFFFARKKGVLAYVLLPLVLLGGALAVLYANSYHMGLLVPVLLFSSWIALDGVTWTACRAPRALAAFSLVGLALMVVQINWTVMGLCYEYHYPYSGLPALADYIKEHDIHDIAVDNINCFGVNAYFPKNIYRNVQGDIPYFVFSKTSNMLPIQGSPRYIVSNYSYVRPKAYYRVRSFFPGAIHNKGYSVSHDDTFTLYERLPH